jgi:hypothetical protein
VFSTFADVTCEQTDTTSLHAMNIRKINTLLIKIIHIENRVLNSCG